MAFTYDLASADPLTVEIALTRFRLGDTVSGRGPRKSGGNFSDEEVTVTLASQGALGATNRPWQGVAALLEILAVEWAPVSDISAGSRSQNFGSRSDVFAKRAEALRRQYGGVGSGLSFSITPARDDGYSRHARPAGID